MRWGGGSGPGNDASRGSGGGIGEEVFGPGEPQMFSIMFSKSDDGRRSTSPPLSDESGKAKGFLLLKPLKTRV